MANPLRWFRRHAKVLMVVLGSGAMAIFGLGPVFDTLSRPSANRGSNENEVVATWKDGDITRNDLNALQNSHFQVQRFLSQMAQAAVDRKGDDFQSLAQPVPPINTGQKFTQTLVDEQLIDRMLMAAKAEAEGIVVSDGIIDDYLAMASGDAGFSRNDLERINQTANQGNCSLENIRRHLRVELLSMQMRMYSMAGLPMVPNPVESMELYGRVAERVECLTMPVSVEQFLGNLGEEPTASEINKLFEEGKHDYADPEGVEPGFKLRNKVKVQYFVANFETFMQNEMNKLTDEDVQKEYDRLVKEKANIVMETIPADDAIQIDDPPPALPGDGEASDDADGVDPPPALEAGDAEGEVEGTESDTESESSDGNSDQSLKVIARKTQYVSLKTQEEETESTSEPGQAESAEPETDEAATAENAEDTAAGSTLETGESETPAGESDTPAGETQTTETPEGELGPLLADESKELEKRVRPLKGVADAVKRAMVNEAARKAMDESIKRAQVKVSSYHAKVMKWEYTDEAKRKEKQEPVPIDFKALAEKHNLVLNETPLSDEFALSESPLGRVAVPMLVRGPNGMQQRAVRSVSQILFDRFDDYKVYEPSPANDFLTGDSYLYWLSEKEDARSPTLEECKDEITKFWKSRKAVELAKAEAQKIVDNVKTQGKPLTELYAERATSTGEFSWFNNFGRLTIGTPANVTDPGDEFMSTAFELKKSGVGMSPNRSKDTIYVIQMVSDRKTVDELGSDYLNNQFFRFKQVPNDVKAVSSYYGRELNYDWNQQFSDEMGLKFMGR